MFKTRSTPAWGSRPPAIRSHPASPPFCTFLFLNVCHKSPSRKEEAVNAQAGEDHGLTIGGGGDDLAAK
ncbi:hypothetical protein NL676_020415 [Syzygium grande]|nr:hypothetical protein NL676_020415 [Syzygium grande]